ncbi:MAG: DUF2726 domain-containing protein [Firmicutes bacterium]|nr:DUF2726 domain-containing protein [Bacillota bacterium]MCL1954072.1 DUF2726 domain-containing protein [Bacillota bacterium]
MISQPKSIIARASVCVVMLSVCLYFVWQTLFLTIIISLLILICLAIIVHTLYRLKRLKLSAPPPKYKTKDNIVSDVEHEFYQKLVRAVPNYTVLQQVPLSNIIEKVSNGAFRNELFRVIDYCIVDRATYKPILLIELNDSSHKKLDRATRDQKIKDICDIANINLIFFYTNIDYDIKTIAKSVKKGIRKKKTNWS